MRMALSRILLLVLTATVLTAAEDAPFWAREAASQPVPDYPSKVTSVILLQEEMVTVDADGRRVMRERGAVKILQPGGESLRSYRTYNVKNGRIRDFQGWLISPGGKSVPYSKNRIIDVALFRNYVYDEARAKVLECGAAAPGSVFAWEVTEEEKTLSTQDRYGFQGRDPVLVSRFILNLPPGWEAHGIVLNHDKLDPQVANSTYSWELRNLPWIEREDHSPSISAIAPHLVVSYFPPADNRGGLQGLRDWTAVSNWLAPMVDPPAAVTDAVRAKALQLTAGSSGELDKIRTIAAFAQQTNYVEVSLNVTRGGGYTPHTAAESLARNYGDCKDKVTLMRALLKAIGVDSYLVTISADDRSYVRPEWASPQQFDHAIIAVKVSGAVALPTVIADSPLGRLLIFDPTDSITPVGSLPTEEQGSYALVVAAGGGALLKMPLLPASANRVEAAVEATMNSNGGLNASLRRQYFGQSGIPLRAVDKLRGHEELQKRFELGFTRRLGGVMIESVETEGTDDSRLTLTFNFAVERFGQMMQDHLLIIRPGMLSSGGEYYFTSRKRSSPVKLEADLRHDFIKVKLPEGFKLDELPAPAKVESAYGSIQATWAVRNGEIVMEQTLEIRDMVVSAPDFAQVRDFFDKVGGIESAPVVLVRQ